MNNAPVEKVERNRELKADYEKGMSIIDLIVKYRITSTRIYQLLRLGKYSKRKVLDK